MSKITFSKSTWQADGWTKESQNVSREKRYLWCVSETIYTNTKNGESGNLTEPIIISVFGEQGERGAIYLGHYASTSNAYSDNEDDISSGDYFLNTADSFIYVYDKDANSWTKISDYSDYRYNQSINDIFENITDSTAKETFIKAKSIWVQNLAAAVARTNLLFSNEITLTSGTDLSGKSTSGKIHSANYKSGTSGWQIDYAGNAEFNNATIRGKVYATSGEFSGSIKGSSIQGTEITASDFDFVELKIGNYYISNILGVHQKSFLTKYASTTVNVNPTIARLIAGKGTVILNLHFLFSTTLPMSNNKLTFFIYVRTDSDSASQSTLVKTITATKKTEDNMSLYEWEEKSIEVNLPTENSYIRCTFSGTSTAGGVSTSKSYTSIFTDYSTIKCNVNSGLLRALALVSTYDDFSTLWLSV